MTGLPLFDMAEIVQSQVEKIDQRQSEAEKKADKLAALSIIYAPQILHWAAYARFYVRKNLSMTTALKIPNVVWSDCVRAHPDFAINVWDCDSLNWMPLCFRRPIPGKERFVKVPGETVASKVYNSHGRPVQVWTLASHFQAVLNFLRERS